MSPAKKTKKQKVSKEETEKADNVSASFGFNEFKKKSKNYNPIKQGVVYDNSELEMHKLLYKYSSDGIIILDYPSLKFSSGNPAAIKIFGVKDEKQFANFTPWDLSPKYQSDGQLSIKKAKGMIEKAMKEGSAFFDWIHKKYKGVNFYATVFLLKVKLGGKEILQAVVKDVSERKKIEESFWVKNFIFNHSMASNSIADTKGVIIEANQSFLDIWGFSEEKEVIGKSLVYFFNDQKDTLSVLNILNKTGKWSGDFVAKKKDGTTFIVYGTAAKLINEEGVFIGYQSSLFDITERKKAEEEILETKSVLDSIVHSTEDGILVVDTQNKIAFLNDKFRELWGIPQEVIESKEDKKLLNFVLDQLADSKEFLKRVNYLYSHNNEESYDLIYFKDGKIFERYSRPQKIKNKIVGRIWNFRDITKQKKNEETVRLDEEKFEEIFNYSPIAIELYNAKGELEKVNKATLEMFGVKNEGEIMGFKLFDDPNIPDNAKKALKNGEVIKYENVFDFEKVRKFNLYSTVKNGTIHLNTVITPIKKGLAGYLVMIEDITQNKNSQIKLQEKLEEMEKMNKLMVGRELKMIELKNKIEEAKLKTKK